MINERAEWLLLYKKVCRMYFTYESNLKKTELELEQIIEEIKNVKSVNTTNIVGHSNKPPEERLLSLIEIKDELERQIQYYQSMINWIFHVNNKVTSPAYRAITWQTLVQAKNRTDLMINYDVDPDYVCKMRDKFLLVALDEESIQEYQKVMKIKNKSKWLSLEK